MKLLVFEDRPSDSPFVERVWRCHSERAGTFLSVAASHCELVVTRHRGRVRADRARAGDAADTGELSGRRRVDRHPAVHRHLASALPGGHPA